SAIVDYDASMGTQDEWLITPSMDLTSATDPHLSFAIGYSYYWSVDPNDNYDVFVKVSTDNGATWTVLWQDSDEAEFTTPFTPINKSISLGDYIGEANVKVAFQYSGMDGAALYLDNILVEDGATLIYCNPVITTIEPITRVVFSDIDNPSAPAVGGSPAVEDFTSIVGNVEIGESYDIALEGNTAGSFTTH